MAVISLATLPAFSPFSPGGPGPRSRAVLAPLPARGAQDEQRQDPCSGRAERGEGQAEMVRVPTRFARDLRSRTVDLQRGRSVISCHATRKGWSKLEGMAWSRWAPENWEGISCASSSWVPPARLESGSARSRGSGPRRRRNGFVGRGRRRAGTLADTGGQARSAPSGRGPRRGGAERPEAIIHQATSLPHSFDFRRFDEVFRENEPPAKRGARQSPRCCDGIWY